MKRAFNLRRLCRLKCYQVLHGIRISTRRHERVGVTAG